METSPPDLSSESINKDEKGRQEEHKREKKETEANSRRKDKGE